MNWRTANNRRRKHERAWVFHLPDGSRRHFARLRSERPVYLLIDHQLYEYAEMPPGYGCRR